MKRKDNFAPSICSRPYVLKAQAELNKELRKLVDSVGGNQVTEPIKIGAQEYKIGFRGKVFAKCDDDWLLSTNVTPEQIQQAHEKFLKSRQKPKL